MRLICPNCDAQYEVSDTAIPVAGRDVQCSSCGHAWFQLPPDVEAERAAEAALHDAPEDPTPPAASVSETAAIGADRTVIAPRPETPPLPPAVMAPPPPAPAPASGPPPAPVSDPVVAQTPQQRQIDESVLAVLREEAEREMIARRLDAQTLETQGELGIDAAIAATVQQDATHRHLSRLRGEDPDLPAAPAEMPALVTPPYAAPEMKRELTRREMLPDIEEINSSLRPGDVAMDDQGTAYEIARRAEPGRSSFRSGFVLMLVLALVGLLAYVMAPQISAQIPAAQPAMDGYVQAVDAGRLWLDSATKGLVTSLRGLAGNDAP